MASSGFSLSVSSRGHDFIIGGSGILDAEGMSALRQAIEESCKREGVSLLIDLTGVSELHPDVVAALVDAGDFCRGLGVPLTLSVGAEVLRVLNEGGYSEELLPL
jgi:anti-anti-sigma regulatory factor